MAFRFSNKSLEILSGVNPKLEAVAKRALQLSKVDFGIPSSGGMRTEAEQYELYMQGKSQLDGHKKKSYHQTGNALDVFAYVDGKASWDEYHLHQVAVAMLQAASELGVHLEWGGHWNSFIDMPHFQIPEGA